MYRLNDLGFDQFELVSVKFTLVGSYQKMVELMVFDHDFKFNEIEIAINQMLQCGHDSAQFGVFKCFIFTFNKEKQSV